MKLSARYDVAARTHVGRVRTYNEDAFVVAPERGRFAVIDGMGGQAAGAVAAEHARQALLEPGDLFDAMLRANRAIVEESARAPERRGMGCVATAVDVGPDRVTVAHVGDTRAYLASDAGTEQLTQDHTAVAADQEAWGLSEAQVRAMPAAHAVTNDLGRRPRQGTRWVEGHEVPFAPGDVLLLCSDGLHGPVPQSALFGLLADAHRRRTGASALADRLIAEALAGGGDDNVTVVVVRRRRSAEQLMTTLSIPFVRGER